MKSKIFVGNRKLVIIMVGLPARGKTFLSFRLLQYLRWLGRETNIFNVGKYRRVISGPDSSFSEFFNPKSQKFRTTREKIAKKCFNDLIIWLKKSGDIAIYDATNVTSGRQNYLAKKCQDNDFDFIFVENICDNPKILEHIINKKIKNSLDYKWKDKKFAKEDFLKRILYYSEVYEKIGENHPFIKIYNFGERIEKNIFNETDFLNDILSFLGSINLTKKNIYLARHGETFFNTQDRIGGNSKLTKKGIKSAKKMAEYFKNNNNLIVFTSAKFRAIQTGGFFRQEKITREDLNEINSGVCDSMTYKEISDKYPDIYKSRFLDKFNFCYPNGESYKNLIYRTRKAIVDIEAQKKDVLIIAHRAVNRCLLSYFIPTTPQDIPYVNMPLDTIFKISSKDFGYVYKAFKI